MLGYAEQRRGASNATTPLNPPALFDVLQSETTPSLKLSSKSVAEAAANGIRLQHANVVAQG